MAIYRNISISFWSDRKVLKKFSPEDKYFFLYLLTNERTTLSGCYELNLDDASCDLGYNIESVENLLKRMETYHGVIKSAKIDDTHYEVLILNWSKYNWNKSIKQIQAVRYGLANITTQEFKDYISAKLDEIEGKKTKDAPEQMPAQETKMKPPTSEDVERYVEEMGYQMDGFSFWFYYNRYGWKDSNKNPIGNWKKFLDAVEAAGGFRKIG